MDLCLPDGTLSRRVHSRSEMPLLPRMYNAMRKTSWGGLVPAYMIPNVIATTRASREKSGSKKQQQQQQQQQHEQESEREAVTETKPVNQLRRHSRRDHRSSDCSDIATKLVAAQDDDEELDRLLAQLMDSEEFADNHDDDDVEEEEDDDDDKVEDAEGDGIFVLKSVPSVAKKSLATHRRRRVVRKK
jgi:hypothetical protein